MEPKSPTHARFSGAQLKKDPDRAAGSDTLVQTRFRQGLVGGCAELMWRQVV